VFDIEKHEILADLDEDEHIRRIEAMRADIAKSNRIADANEQFFEASPSRSRPNAIRPRVRLTDGSSSADKRPVRPRTAGNSFGPTLSGVTNANTHFETSSDTASLARANSSSGGTQSPVPAGFGTAPTSSSEPCG
jgi:hypothetical protein